MLINGEDTRDRSYGKFDSGMAVALYYGYMANGDNGDDDDSDGDGAWFVRYGRRFLSGDDRGFVYYSRATTIREAETWAEDWREINLPQSEPDAYDNPQYSLDERL
jgi:hypothetical protein